MNSVTDAEIGDMAMPAPDEKGAGILIVGHEDDTRKMLAALLDRHGYSFSTAVDASAARAYISTHEFAVVLADMDLPGLSGLELVMKLTHEQPDMAMFICTGMNDPKLVQTALEMGAFGYMIKPLEPSEVVINLANALRRRKLEMENRWHREKLQQTVRDRTIELRGAIGRLQHAETELHSSREETIERLSTAAEFKDNESARHIKRISGYCRLLARATGEDEKSCEMVRVASQLHDVGKIGIPDHILLKTGSLTESEIRVMRQHTEIGYRILAGSQSDLLSIAAGIALTHHERIDGTGYPKGLRGDDIPVEGRIVAVADVFDGLTTHRPYKKAVELEEAIRVMRAESQGRLDADLVDLFIGSMDSVLAVQAQFKEG